MRRAGWPGLVDCFLAAVGWDRIEGGRACFNAGGSDPWDMGAVSRNEAPHCVHLANPVPAVAGMVTDAWHAGHFFTAMVLENKFWEMALVFI